MDAQQLIREDPKVMAYPKKWPIRVLALIIFAGCVWSAGAYVSAYVGSTVKPRYAVEWTTLLLLEHLESNNDCWPKSWEDLRDDFNSRPANAYPFDFRELQELVEVRWDIQLPQDRAVFSDERYQVMQIPDSNRFRTQLEPEVIRWNREVRDYVFLGTQSDWLRSNIRAK